MMKKNLTVFALLAIIVFTACARQKKTATAAQTSNGAISSVKMSRGACFGRCPVYNIEIFSDGLVRYSNIRFTKDTGIYEKNIGTAKVNEIFSEFRKYRVDTCSEKYHLNIADLPGLNYTIHYGSKQQTIMNAHFGPSFLKEIGRKIDAEIQVDESWKKVADTWKE